MAAVNQYIWRCPASACGRAPLQKVRASCGTRMKTMSLHLFLIVLCQYRHTCAVQRQKEYLHVQYYHNHFTFLFYFPPCTFSTYGRSIYISKGIKRCGIYLLYP